MRRSGCVLLVMVVDDLVGKERVYWGTTMHTNKENGTAESSVIQWVAHSDLGCFPCCQREANLSSSTRSSSYMRLILSSLCPFWLHSSSVSLFLLSDFSQLYCGWLQFCFWGYAGQGYLRFSGHMFHEQEWGSVAVRVRGIKRDDEDVCPRDQPVYIPIWP